MKTKPYNIHLVKFENIIKNKINFKVGDSVRISRIKALFEKDYLPNWSEALYIIYKVQKTVPVTYKIKDSMGRIIDGSFYNEELQKSDQEVYRVEKVIRKKKIDGENMHLLSGVVTVMNIINGFQ